MIRAALRKAWGEYRDFRSVMRAAKSWSRRTRQPFARFVANAVQAKLDYEQTPHCSFCDSMDLDYHSGLYPTGVVAPDGGREMWWGEWVRCNRCGSREELENAHVRRDEGAEDRIRTRS